MAKLWQTPSDYLTNQVTVHLIGCGGTGSFVMAELSQLHELLLRLGHPGLDVVAFDGSPVREANLGRQRFNAIDLGLPKSKALIDAENCYNGFGWTSHGDYEVGRVPASRINPYLVITAIDKPSFRRDFGRWFKDHGAERKNWLWIDAGNDHTSGQVVLGGSGLPTAYDLFATQYAQLQDDDTKSCSSEEAVARQDFGVNSMAARIVGQLIWNMLRHGGLQQHGAFFDSRRLSVDPLPVDEKVWATYGV